VAAVARRHESKLCMLTARENANIEELNFISRDHDALRLRATPVSRLVKIEALVEAGQCT
jgi:hypothetical protein